MMLSISQFQQHDSEVKAGKLRSDLNFKHEWNQAARQYRPSKIYSSLTWWSRFSLAGNSRLGHIERSGSVRRWGSCPCSRPSSLALCAQIDSPGPFSVDIGGVLDGLTTSPLALMMSPERYLSCANWAWERLLHRPGSSFVRDTRSLPLTLARQPPYAVYIEFSFAYTPFFAFSSWCGTANLCLNLFQPQLLLPTWALYFVRS